MPFGALPTSRRWRRVLLVSVAIAGCGSAAAVRTPGPGFVDVSLPPLPVATSPLAVVVDDTAPVATTTYALRLVDGDAHTAVSLGPARRTGDAPGPSCRVARLPVASASAHRVFFLDGDATLKYVDPDGATGMVRKLDNPTDTEVTFAVSPDETRMALMTVVPTIAGYHEEVVVETLGGAAAVTIFTREASGSGSSGEISWPVGWHGDALVLADGPARPASTCMSTPVPTGYDLVDPVSGAARLHFCFSTADATPSGAPAAAGVLCTGHADAQPAQAVADIEAWDGTSSTLAPAAACRLDAVLAPDGSRAAADPCRPGDDRLDLIARGGSTTPTSASGTPLGWLDATHVVASAGGALLVLDAKQGTVHSGGPPGALVAVLPPLL